MQSSQRKRRALAHADEPTPAWAAAGAAPTVAEKLAGEVISAGHGTAPRASWLDDFAPLARLSSGGGEAYARGGAGDAQLLDADALALLDDLELLGEPLDDDAAPWAAGEDGFPSFDASLALALTAPEKSGDSGSGSGTTAPLRAATAAATSAPAPLRAGDFEAHAPLVLRCIDPEHPANCTRCAPAPAPEMEGGYELVGDPGKKNGEKRLRHLITRTPEWCSPEERRRLAAEFAATPGNEALTAALQNKACSALRKGHLLALVRAWGYKADLWARRGGGGQRGAAAVAVAPPPTTLALAAPQPAVPAIGGALGVGAAATTDGDALADYLSTRLRTLAIDCGSSAAGAAGREAAQLHGAPHITPAYIERMAALAVLLRGVADGWRAMSSCLHGRAAALVPDSPEATIAAYLTCLGKETPVEKLLFEMTSLVQSAAATYTMLLGPGDGGPPLGAAERVMLSENTSGTKLTMELLARVAAIIAQARLATHFIALRTVAAASDLLALWASTASSGFAAQEAWMRDYVAVHGAGTVERKQVYTQLHALQHSRVYALLAELNLPSQGPPGAAAMAGICTEPHTPLVLQAAS